MHKENRLLGRLREGNSKNKFILNLFQDLQRLGFDNNTHAFTLIELLVVVLIIGILAAVALPQYKVAVAKARMTQLVTLANSVVQAEERYYLANGTYTKSWDELDIDLNGTVSGATLSSPAGWRLVLSPSEGAPDSIYAYGDSFLPVFLIFGYPHSSSSMWTNTRACYARSTSSLANAVCRNATGKTARDRDSDYGVYNVYFFQ